MIAIISILAGMLLPALDKARERARRGVCKNNLRQIAMAVVMYAGEYDGFVAKTPATTLKPYLDGSNYLLLKGCPSRSPLERNGPNGNRSYGLNSVLIGAWSWTQIKISKLESPSKCSMFTDCFLLGYTSPDSYETDTLKGFYGTPGRHRGEGLSWLFCDGHAEWLNAGPRSGNFYVVAEWRTRSAHRYPSTDLSPPCGAADCFWHPY